MKVVYYISLLVLIIGCSKNAIYVRHTDLHHTKPVQLFSIQNTKDSLSCTRISYDYAADSIITKVYTFALTDTNFTYVKQKSVIQFYGSYYIRDNVKSKRIYEAYYNRDVEFWPHLFVS